MPIPLQVPFLLVIFEGPKHCFCRVDRGRMVVTFQYAERQSLGLESSIENDTFRDFFRFRLSAVVDDCRFPALCLDLPCDGVGGFRRAGEGFEGGAWNSDCGMRFVGPVCG